jgi:hypothetical protein
MPRFTVPRVAHCESGAADGPGPSNVPDVTGVPLAGLADVPGAKFGSAI